MQGVAVRGPVSQGLAVTADRAHAARSQPVQQCGDRFVVTSTGIIHDFHADGTLKNGARDTEGPSGNCTNIWASMDVDESQVLNFHPFGLSSVTIVKRWMVGDELHWEYPKFDDVVKMKRLCKVPEAHRVYTLPE